MSKLAKDILKKVKDEKIKKTPKWIFALKRVFIWGTLAIAITMGAISISMILFQLNSLNWGMLPEIRTGRLGFSFKIIPYFWILASIILFTFVYFDFKKTKTGYRHSGTLIVGISVLISLILGTMLFSIKASERMENYLQKNIYYKQIQPNKEDFIHMPKDHPQQKKPNQSDTRGGIGMQNGGEKLYISNP